jgi:hypothetical protein
MELRCDSKLHGIVVDQAIEIKCNSQFCGAAPGVTVLHRFDPDTGQLLSTNQYKTPERSQPRGTGHTASVRSA